MLRDRRTWASVAVATTLVTGGFVLVRAGWSGEGESLPAAPLPVAQFSVPVGSGAARAARAAGAVEPATQAVPACPSPASGVPASGAQVLIPGLCVRAPAVPVGLQQDGSLTIPRDLHQVGVWDGGAGLSATDRRGTTVVAGHVNALNEGEGAFYRLSDVTPNELILTRDGAGRVTRWRASSLRVVDKWSLPSDLFVGDQGPRRLVLVTCGGEVLRVPGHGNVYAKNVIVTAVPDPAAPRQRARSQPKAMPSPR